MKLKIAVLTVAAALLGVSAAFATPPAGKGKPTTTQASTNAAKPTVMFVLHGALSKYTAANGTTNGSVTITVSSSNRNRTALKNQALTLVVTSSTKVVLHEGAAIKDGDRGIVKVRAAKAASLPGTTAVQVIDQGAASS